jgi:sensor histidine kinase YesM
MLLQQVIYKYKIHHLFFWSLLFGGWYYFRYQDFSSPNKALLVTLIKVIDLAIMVYITNYLLIPKLLYKKRVTSFALLFFVMVVASSFFKIYVIATILNPLSEVTVFDKNFKVRVYDNVIPHFLLVSTGGAFKLLIDYAKAQKRIGDMAKEKAEAELSFLKSQINPHFLFNSLNSVYFLIDKSNSEARNALHKFSEMLRYQLYEIKDEKIPIEKEISYIQDYIDLQRLRRDEKCSVKFNIDEDVKHFFIEPLLLVPFVENSFKHLSHFANKKLNEIKINLERENGEMRFFIKNTTEEKRLNEVKKYGGIGLSNIKRRLELLYPKKHELIISEDDGWFDVQLKMEIK